MSWRPARRGVSVVVASCAVVAALLVPGGAIASAAVGERADTARIDAAGATLSSTCDASTGRLAYTSRYRPPCVRTKTAGGASRAATAAGVTASSIKVALLVPSDGQLNNLGIGQALPVNQATRQVGTFADAARDALTMFDRAGFETWGRQVEISVVVATGADEAAQRADAATVVAQRPFAVVVPLPAATGGIGGPVFERAVADAKIVVVGYPTTREALEQAPYRWSASGSDDRAQVQLAAEFAADALAGRRATHAGTPDLRSATRAFGVVYPTGPTGIEGDRFARVVHEIAGSRVKVVTSGYDPALATADPAQLYQQVLPGIVASMRTAGVTTVVPFVDSAAMNALMKAATNLAFAPEWISTAMSTASTGGVIRSWDQDQASRFFGLQSATVPVVTPAATQPLTSFQWYWGTNLGTTMGGITTGLELVRLGVHLAGPRLTASAFSTGMCSMGALGGAADNTQTAMRAPCRAAGLPWYEHHSGPGLDASLGWWDPTAVYTTSVGQTIGPGAWRFLDDGKRYRSGTFPHREPAFFRPDEAIVAYDSPRARDFPPSYPCTGCPGGQSAALTVDVTPAPRVETQFAAAAASGASLPEDFADPFVVYEDGFYYAFSTGGPRGMIQTARSRDLTSWTWLGAALTTLPRWSTGRSSWAPSLLHVGNRWLMYYAARDRVSGQWCLSYAAAPALNAVFVDATTAPFVCQPDRGGSIDPHAFTDRSGTHYLLWKTVAAPGSPISVLVGAPMTVDGTALAGPERTLLAADGGWDGQIIENPAMTIGSDGYTLLYSGNSYEGDKYAVGVARCAGPLGPCARASAGPALASAGSVLGPGGAVAVSGPDGARSLVFAAWAAPRVGYRAGGARSLYVRPLTSLGLAPT